MKPGSFLEAKLSVIGCSGKGDIPWPVGEVRFGRLTLPTFILVDALGDVKLPAITTSFNTAAVGCRFAAPFKTPPQSLLRTASNLRARLNARVREWLLSYTHRSGGSEEPQSRILYCSLPD